MTILDQVRGFVTRLSPEAVCDDWIADKLDLAVRQYATRKARELAGSDGFERKRDACSMCLVEKLVIRLK